jgi:hypothetical protein
VVNYSPAPMPRKDDVTISNVLPLLAADAPTSPAQRGMATLRRHKDERRAESLRQISAQIADGTLVVRHMTEQQQKAASQLARQTRAKRGLASGIPTVGGGR